MHACGGLQTSHGKAMASALELKLRLQLESTGPLRRLESHREHRLAHWHFELLVFVKCIYLLPVA